MDFDIKKRSTNAKNKGSFLMLVIQSTDAKNKGSLLLLSVTNKGSFLVLVIQSADAKNKSSFLMLAVTPRIKHQRGTSGSMKLPAVMVLNI